MSAERHRVVLTKKADKDLQKLRHDLDNVVRQLRQLETDPLRGEPLKGNLRDARSLHFTLKGGGQYRAVYVIAPDDTVCVVFLVATRENVYVEAERRLKALDY